MKESGINYFHWDLGLQTGTFAVFYTFEEGVGSIVSSVSGGQSQYSGVLNSSSSFWVSPGSGFFSGNFLQVSNANSLQSTSWTKMFVFEKTSVNPIVLFDSLALASGHRIGVNYANKPYFQTTNIEPIVVTSSNDYASKNVITVAYVPNYVTLGYYNFNSHSIESESFSAPFQLNDSDDQRVGSSFTGWMDYYLHFTEYISPQVQSQLLSGLFNRPTGTGFLITTICTTGITGSIPIFGSVTGTTGYSTVLIGDEGQGYYTGWFPLDSITTVYTGLLGSGIFFSGLTGITCYPMTGALTVLFEIQSGYAASFGMEKIQLFSYIQNNDIVKTSISHTPFDDRYNITPMAQYSGYHLEATDTTGALDIFFNGIAQAGSGWIISNGYLFLSGAGTTDSVFLDSVYGDKKVYAITGLAFQFTYSGQEIYLNGVNLISGQDYTVSQNNITLTNNNTGISGYISEYPVVLTSTTGIYTVFSTPKFWRNTSNIYFNGIRQQKDILYTEGAVYDLLSGNSFNPNVCATIYDNNNNYWE